MDEVHLLYAMPMQDVAIEHHTRLYPLGGYTTFACYLSFSPFASKKATAVT